MPAVWEHTRQYWGWGRGRGTSDFGVIPKNGIGVCGGLHEILLYPIMYRNTSKNSPK